MIDKEDLIDEFRKLLDRVEFADDEDGYYVVAGEAPVMRIAGSYDLGRMYGIHWSSRFPIDKEELDEALARVVVSLMEDVLNARFNTI